MENLAVKIDIKATKKKSDPLLGETLCKLQAVIQSCGVSFHIWKKKKDASSKLDWTSLGGSEKRKVIAQLPSQFRELLPSEYWTAITELWKVCMYVKQTIIKY